MTMIMVRTMPARYTVSDGTENSDPGTMSIHVDAVNDAPTSANGNLQLNGDDEFHYQKTILPLSILMRMSWPQ